MSFLREFFGHDEPLGMPKGSVRAIFVLLLVLSLIVSQHRGMSPHEAVETLLKVAFGFYFGVRAAKVANGNGSN